MTKNERDLRAIKKVRGEKAKQIEEIWAIEQKEDRPLEEAEREEVLELTKALDELRRQQDEVEANIALEQKVKEASGAIGEVETVSVEKSVSFPERPGPVVEGMQTLGQQFVSSKAYKETFGGGTPKGVDWRTSSVELNTKATVLSGGTISGYGSYTQHVGGVISIAEQPLTIADLLPSNTANAPQIAYYKERVATNAAAGVAESNLKPESAFDFTARTQSLTKIATFLPVSDEMLEDAPAIEAYLNARLSLFVRQEEEQQILTGAGSGSNEVEGFLDNYALNSVGSATITGTSGTAVYRGLLNVMNNQRGSSFLEPDTLVMAPRQFGSILSYVDSNAQFYAGGPVNAVGAYGAGRTAETSRLANQYNIWGMRVLVTSNMTNRRMLLGNFRTGAAIWRKGGISVQASNSHSDFFQRNQTAIRAEERLALTVYRPEAFTVISW